MSLTALLRVLARRWVLVLPATILVVIAVTAVGRAMASTHEATAIGVVLPGTAQLTRDAIAAGELDTDDDTELRSPYLRVGSSEQRAAEALVGSLGDRDLPGNVDIELHPAQPILRVTANGTSATQVERDAADALDQMRAHFETRQRARAVPPELFLRLESVNEPAAERINEARARAMTAAGTLGGLVIVGLALAAERVAIVFRRVRAVTTGDRGPVAVLVAFAVVLIAVPQIHSLGPFAVTGPMVVGAVAGGLWAAGRFLPGTLPGRMPAVGIAFAVFLATAIASYGLAQLRPLEELEASGADRRVALLVMFAGITLLAAEGIRTAGQLRRLLAVVVALGAVHALVGALQAFGGFDIGGLTRVNSPRGGFPRVAGTARHPIDFGVFCAAVLPLALHFASYGATQRARLASAAGAAAVAGGAVLSITRSALLGLAVGSIVLVAGRQGLRRWSLLGAGLVLLALAPLVVPDFATSVSEMVGEAPDSPSIQSRVADYEPVLDVVGRNPFLGRGTGTFEPSVHFVLDNNYLSLLVENGVIGLTAFLVVLGTALAASRRVRRQSFDPAVRDQAQGLAAAIAVLAVAMGTYDLLAFQLGGGLLFLLLGCAAAQARLIPPEPAPSSPERAADRAEVAA